MCSSVSRNQIAFSEGSAGLASSPKTTQRAITDRAGLEKAQAQNAAGPGFVRNAPIIIMSAVIWAPWSTVLLNLYFFCLSLLPEGDNHARYLGTAGDENCLSLAVTIIVLRREARGAR